MMSASILIVDDDEVVGNVLCRVLTRHGYKVLYAANAINALNLANTCHPRLALLDLCLPDSDGFDLGRQLRLHFPDIGLVLITAFPLRVRENPELGREFTRILTKPLDLKELCSVVEEVLSVAAQRPV